MGSFFSGPKVPAPPPLPAPPKVDDTALTEDRMRRQKAAGTTGNVLSSLSTAKTDTETTSRISKLLG